ncbi:hypothetical protein, partial [Bosea sp. (in: a-proteobacteria)]|uniref:hypothetical protein n=1 Tax=Bosea sp. (in: a-proteobacteria) TaxID=1871050 RepID=UPI003F6FA486
LVKLWVMTLILWRGGDPFADEFTLEAGASVRCSGGNKGGATFRQTPVPGPRPRATPPIHQMPVYPDPDQ